MSKCGSRSARLLTGGLPIGREGWRTTPFVLVLVLLLIGIATTTTSAAEDAYDELITAVKLRRDMEIAAGVKDPPDDPRKGKYPSRDGTKTVFICSEQSGYPITGKVMRSSALVADYGDPEEMCEKKVVPRRARKYCNAKKRTFDVCPNGEINEDILIGYGRVGQDCETWSYVLAYADDPAGTIADLLEDERCNGGKRSRRLLGCGQDVTHGCYAS